VYVRSVKEKYTYVRRIMVESLKMVLHFVVILSFKKGGN